MSKKSRRRTDYWDDPKAPAPTSRKPSASVVLRNHRGELLLLRRTGSGLWTIPTGALKTKETATACAIRECREETGLTVELTGLVGVFTDPRHRIAYPDGEVRVPVNVCFYGQPVSGELATDSESGEAAWVAPEDLDDYDIHPAIRRRISHALNGTVPHVDLTAAVETRQLTTGISARPLTRPLPPRHTECHGRRLSPVDPCLDLPRMRRPHPCCHGNSATNTATPATSRYARKYPLSHLMRDFG